MTKRYFLPTGLAIALIITITIFQLYSGSGNKILTITSSYQDVNFSELNEASSVIVKGQIVDDGQSKKVDLEKKPLEQEWVIYTDKTFKVDKVYKANGENIKAGDEIKIRSMGGQADGNSQNFEISVNKNKEYVLFLSRNSYPENNGIAYTIINGNNGVFSVNDRVLTNPKFKEINSLEVLETKLK